jgi:hypothetical protein
MIDHHIFNTGNPETKKEVDRYLELFKCLEELGVRVYRGADGSAFDNYLQVYKRERKFTVWAA